MSAAQFVTGLAVGLLIGAFAGMALMALLDQRRGRGKEASDGW